MKYIFDSHCHLQFGLSESLARIPSLKPKYFGIASTSPADWAAVQEFQERFHPSKEHSDLDTDIKVIYPAYGVHPWWAHKVNEPREEWLTRLKLLLQQTPHAVCGEIGLDKLTAKREAPGVEVDWQDLYATQKDVFVNQLKLATELNKPVVCHCVGSFGDMMEIFQAQRKLPPMIYMHAFGGSVDYAKCLQKLPDTELYFGFASAINLKAKKTREVLRSIPPERILLESDLEQPHRLDECIDTMLEVMAETIDWDGVYAHDGDDDSGKSSSRDAVISLTSRNAARFYDRSLLGTDTNTGA